MHGEARPTTIPHVAALDGARGVAVAGVLLFHGGHLSGGYLGVDFFFTLSGFLITSLLLGESAQVGSVRLRNFWFRRARRLLPALAVLMAGVALYSATVAIPEQLGQIRADAIATLAYVANWHEIFAHQNYFALFTNPSPLNHTWSLAIEEQFYLVWPVLFVLLFTRFKRSTPKAVLVASLTLTVVAYGLMNALYDPNNATRSYFGTDTRAGAILLGAAFAAWTAGHGHAKARGSRIALEALGLCGAAVLAIAWTHLDGQSSSLYRGGFLLCGLAATAVIAAAVHPEGGPLSRALSFRPLQALGLISYGVYLYHWPIDVFLNSQRVGFGGWGLFAVQTVVTLTVAVMSYFIVEQPIRRGSMPKAQLVRLGPVVALGLVLALLLGTNGARSPLVPAALSADPIAVAKLAYQAAPPGSRRVMVVGDSVAFFLGAALESLSVKPRLFVLNEGLPACSFPPQLTGPPYRFPNGAIVLTTPCDRNFEAATVKAFRPEVVFWIVSAPRGGDYRGKRLQPCSPTYDALYEESLRRVVSDLGRYGAKVVITTAAYEPSGLQQTDRGTACDNRLRRRVAAATGAQLIDLFEYICPHGQCRVKQDGVTLRPDGFHYEGKGGEIVARWLVEHVR